MRHHSLLISATRGAAVLAFALTSAAVGQAPRDTLRAIPRDLVEGLLMPFNMGFGNNIEFTVGDVPPSLKPFLYVPKGAHVIGGMSNGSAVYVVMSAQASSQDVSAEFRREQPKLGWTVPPTANRSWGFVAAQAATYDNGGLQFCHINQSLEIRPLGRPGVTQISVIVQNNGRCGQTGVVMAGQPGTSILPALENPFGTTMNVQSCFQTVVAGTGPTATTERVQTNLSPAQLLDAFAKQLSDSGYKSNDGSAGPIRRTWTRPDSGETIREVTLQVTPNGGSGTTAGCMEVTMSARRTLKPR